MSEQAGNGHDGGGHAAGLFPVPGDGVLARHGDLILLCSLEDSQAADAMLDLIEQTATAGGDGRQFADAIANMLEATDRSPSVLAFGPSAAGLAITISGGAWADITTPEGTARIEAGHPKMLLRGTVRSAISGVRGGLSRSDSGAASTDRFSRLDAGTVRAGGLSYYSDGRMTGRGAAAAAVPQEAPAQKAAAHEPAAQKAAAQKAAAQEAAAQEAAAREAAARDAAAAAQQAGAAPQVRDGDAAEPGEPEPPKQEEPFDPTQAWAGPEEPAAQERQPTELWSDQAGAANAEGAAGVAPDVTAPPDYYEQAGFDPMQGQPFEAVLLLDAGPGGGVDAPVRQPLPKVKDLPPGASSYVSAGPIIQGVYCKNGHFDDPEALFCAICGISMNQQTLVPRPGERPPLGVLLLDDGAVFQLDSDYVIGREPGLDGSVAEGKARPLRISDETGIVSRVHVRVHLDGWRVLVTDLGSANGTRVLLPGQPAEQPLVPQVPIVLATGSQVDLGGRGFRYESHRGR
ncbi:MAG: FHA domain-containing protein [Nocardiopsaceae bacterium]|jgi:hypothetical protein|nr:FHA domain-containing protein [Nocardiopsaceae bacterium]